MIRQAGGQGGTALHWAAAHGAWWAVEALLKKGAPLVTGTYVQGNAYDSSPLHLAADAHMRGVSLEASSASPSREADHLHCIRSIFRYVVLFLDQNEGKALWHGMDRYGRTAWDVAKESTAIHAGFEFDLTRNHNSL